MKLTSTLAGIALACTMATASAEIEPFKDYTISESVSNVTTVKVANNRIDDYLEGLRSTWVPANDIAVELGQISGYAIYVSQLPAGGDFNVVLVIEMANASDMQPSEEDYDAFMAKWADKHKETTDEIVPTYPNMRKITGEYLMREITFK